MKRHVRVLVTGGAGFIGSHVVDHLLAAGHAPSVVDNLSTGRKENLPSTVPLFEVDVCDRPRLAEVFDQVRPEAVCHQAAQTSVSRSVREPAFDARINLVGLLHVLELCRDHNVRRIVFASSGGVLYGDVYAPATEEHPANPQSPYGISKWAGEQYLRLFASQGPLEAVALRYANVYGPRQSPLGEAGVVAIFSQRMLRGEQTTINGDGKSVRDYVNVADVARANCLSLETPLAERFSAWNVGTGVPTDVNFLAVEVHRLCTAIRADRGQSPPPLPTHGPSRAGDLRSNLVSFERIERDLAWRPEVPLAEGLEQTVAWFAEQ